MRLRERTHTRTLCAAVLGIYELWKCRHPRLKVISCGCFSLCCSSLLSFPRRVDLWFNDDGISLSSGISKGLRKHANGGTLIVFRCFLLLPYICRCEFSYGPVMIMILNDCRCS